MTQIITAVAVMDLEGQLLLGRRADSGLYGVPGGKLEPDEPLKTGAARELLEETGLRAEEHDLVELGFCERLDKHQLVFWFWASQYRGHARNTEPDKCHGWQHMYIPADEVCIKGLRLFRRKLLGVLENVSGIKARRAA